MLWPAWIFISQKKAWETGAPLKREEPLNGHQRSGVLNYFDFYKPLLIKHGNKLYTEKFPDCALLHPTVRLVMRNPQHSGSRRLWGVLIWAFANIVRNQRASLIHEQRWRAARCKHRRVYCVRIVWQGPWWGLTVRSGLWLCFGDQY